MKWYARGEHQQLPKGLEEIYFSYRDREAELFWQWLEQSFPTEDYLRMRDQPIDFLLELHTATWEPYINSLIIADQAAWWRGAGGQRLIRRAQQVNADVKPEEVPGFPATVLMMLDRADHLD